MKSKIFCAMVALAMVFSACNKDTPNQNLDEGVNIKGFMKLNPYDDKGDGGDVAYWWNSIYAADFAKGITPAFNNFEQYLCNAVTIFRAPEGEELRAVRTASQIDQGWYSGPNNANGNGNVYLLFEDKSCDIDLNGIFYLMVRYKASNNVAFAFDLLTCIKYCAKNGPISLQWQDFAP